jgi:predicted transcriptional regulator
MKDIILSIHPKWAEKIYSGEKTVEVRKTQPNWEKPEAAENLLIYLYETAPVKKVTGVVFLTWVHEASEELLEDLELYFATSLRNACLTAKEMIEYSKGKNLYFWDLKDPFRFDTPKDIKGSVSQSWRYLKEGERYD